MSVEAFNHWLTSHQLLVTLVATPTLSLLVGGLAAWYSGRRVVLSARTERMHQSAIEISRYRQAWIDALRDDFAEFGGITAVQFNGPPPGDKVERVAVLAMRIRMRMNRSDADYNELVTTLTRDTEKYFLGQREAERTGQPIVSVSQGILKREWERLKADLREAEK